MALNKAQMIEEILLAVTANTIAFESAPVTRRKVPDVGDTFFALAFRTEGELRAICGELHINTLEG